VPLIPPLTVAVPLAAAALLAVLGSHLRRWMVAAIATVAATAVTTLQILQLLRSWSHHLDHYFGGWHLVHGIPVGIVFTVDPVDAGLAAVTGLLMVAALAYSWIDLREVSHVYYVLMLAFLAGMSGFAISGDLFDIFVFFELMSISGYALCSFRNTSSSVLQGALNFAIVNTIGALFFLMGIALIYGRTGALNLAQIAVALHGHRPDTLVVVAFIFILVGLLVKGGAVPFHFWLSDAYAVAAAPVGAIYAGIMSDLGYHAIATIYSKAFAGSITGSLLPALRMLLIVVGAVTVVTGAVMCFIEADLKRQLAFLVVSHGGTFLIGIGLLDAAGLAGSTLDVIADGLDKGALFLVIGFLVATTGGSDELLLQGRGRTRRHVVAGLLFSLAALGFADLPGFGTWLSFSLTEHAAVASGFTWAVPVLLFGAAVTAGTMLRAAGRIFLGWGAQTDALLTAQQPDEPEGEPNEDDRRPPSRWVLAPAASLVLLGYGMAFAPHLASYAIHSADGFVDLRSYVAEALHGHSPATPSGPSPFSPSRTTWLLGTATTVAAFGVAAAGLWWHRLPALLRSRARRPLLASINGLKSLHSGRVGDMTAWLAFGAGTLCVVAVVTLR
jgi:multicomponent Na+:H+ antiporter subunit D